MPSVSSAVTWCKKPGCGETDTTPVGAMGKVTQLAFGAMSPGHVNINLMSANITAGAATSSADLLTDLKSGYLLGANPRQANRKRRSIFNVELCEDIHQMGLHRAEADPQLFDQIMIGQALAHELGDFNFRTPAPLDRIIAMRAGAIVDDVPVRAARPRDTDSLLLPDMVAIKHKLLGHLGLEHRAKALSGGAAA